jgi:hypothetical protein
VQDARAAAAGERERASPRAHAQKPFNSRPRPLPGSRTPRTGSRPPRRAGCRWAWWRGCVRELTARFLFKRRALCFSPAHHPGSRRARARACLSVAAVSGLQARWSGWHSCAGPQSVHAVPSEESEVRASVGTQRALSSDLTLSSAARRSSPSPALSAPHTRPTAHASALRSQPSRAASHPGPARHVQSGVPGAPAERRAPAPPRPPGRRCARIDGDQEGGGEREG